MNLADILQLKFPSVSMMDQVIVQDDGQGPYIKKWDASLGAQPTQEQLDIWAIELAPLKLAQEMRESRRLEYPAIGDQLDAIFHAMETGIIPKVPEFYNPIKTVKDKFPLVNP